MRMTTISSKGQITIPVAILRGQNLHPGAQLVVIPLANGLALIERPTSMTDVIAGSAEGVYDEDYVERERAAWS